MAKIKVYGKGDIESLATRILETGEEILPTDEHKVLYVTTNPSLVDAIGHFRLENTDFFIGHRK